MCVGLHACLEHAMLVHPGLCEQAPAGVVKAWRSQVGVGVQALRAALSLRTAFHACDIVVQVDGRSSVAGRQGPRDAAGRKLGSAWSAAQPACWRAAPGGAHPLVCALAKLQRHIFQEWRLPGECCKEAGGLGTAPSLQPSWPVGQSRPSTGPVHVMMATQVTWHDIQMSG